MTLRRTSHFLIFTKKRISIYLDKHSGMSLDTKITLFNKCIVPQIFKNTRLPTQGWRVRSRFEKCSRVSVLYTGHVKEPGFVMCGGRSSILHYGPLIETICMPDAKWAKPECVATQKQNPFAELSISHLSMGSS